MAAAVRLSCKVFTADPNSHTGELGEKPAAVEREERLHCLRVKIVGHVFSWKTFYGVILSSQK